MSTTSRVYTAGPDGRCTVCQRTEAEHAPQAWSETPRACPPLELAASRCETEGRRDFDRMREENQRGWEWHQRERERAAARTTRAIDEETVVADVPPTNTLRAMRLCQRCGRPMVDHPGDGCPDANAHTGPESDREEAAHTVATAQAEIARYQALVVKWRSAHRMAIESRRALDRAPPGTWQVSRDILDANLELLDAAEIALAKSVPEVAS